jgi:ribonuclease HII
VDSRYIPCVIYAGIDEAGYGPLLGPLCVGTSAFRLCAAAPSSDSHAPLAPPDLWKALASGVCRKPKDARRRIAVADSKKLKSAGKQPLVHLERGVLAFLGGEIPADDASLFARLGVSAAGTRATPWHTGALPLPVAISAAEAAIARNLVSTALDRAGASLAALGVAALDPPAFNALYDALGNKASINLSLVYQSLRAIDLARGEDDAFVAVDRQGGRGDYRDGLAEHLADGRPVRVVEETDERSTYAIGGGGTRSEGALVVSFEVEAEDHHLPVALASMAAKYTRELSMRRLNAFFAERLPELAPTAGYVEDGRRFLREVKPILLREAIPERGFVRAV